MLLVISVQIWAGLKTYGGSNWDELWDIDFNASGSRIVLSMFSTTYKIDASEGGDFVVLVSNPAGTPIWERIVGIPNMNEWNYKIIYDNEGNLIMGGVSCEPMGSFFYCLISPSNRAFVIKLNGADGSFLSARDIVGTGDWNAGWIRIMGMGSTSDGGFVVAGDIMDNSFDQDSWVAKFDANMNLQWGKVMGTPDDEWFTSVFQTTDGNIVVVGASAYWIYVAKLNVTNGNIIWQRVYERSGRGLYLTGAIPSSDGSIIIAHEIDGGVNKSDVLFVKLDGNGNFVCGRQIGSLENDAGVDVVEGSDYYYVAGAWNSDDTDIVPLWYADLFYARFDKTNCNLVGNVIRYILAPEEASVSLESASAIDIRPGSGIPYIAGYTSKAEWIAGTFNGLLAADSGLQDTCYWRSLTPPINVSVSLSASGSYTDYGNQLSVSSASYSSIPVLVNKTIACGLLTPVNNDERYEDCYISISKDGKFLKIRSKQKQDIYIRLYSVNGKLVYDRFLKEFVGDLDERIKLSSGVYIANVKYGVRELNRKFIVR